MAPRIERICNLEVMHQLGADHMVEQPYYTSPMLSVW